MSLTVLNMATAGPCRHLFCIPAQSTMLLLFEGSGVDSLCAWWEKCALRPAAKGFLVHTFETVTSRSLVGALLCLIAITTFGEYYQQSPTQQALMLHRLEVSSSASVRPVIAAVAAPKGACCVAPDQSSHIAVPVDHVWYAGGLQG